MKKKILLTIVLVVITAISWTGIIGCLRARKNYFYPITNRNGQTNILLLGINGKGGADTNLTDSIMLVSLNKKTKKAVMISVPRDLWVESIKAKINTAYHYGGDKMVREVVTEVTGQPIDYLVVIDFDGFRQVVDTLGGVYVDVKTAFTDTKFPISGKEKDLCNGDPLYLCRYETITFDAGRQMMDGELALKYIRSRNAEGDEGTDFARAERQQQFLKGLKEKLTSPEVLLNPSLLLRLYNLKDQIVTTDIKVNQYGSFLQLAKAIDWNNLKSTAINGNLLIHPTTHYSKQWVLIPKGKGWEDIHNFVFSQL